MDDTEISQTSVDEKSTTPSTFTADDEPSSLTQTYFSPDLEKNIEAESSNEAQEIINSELNKK